MRARSVRIPSKRLPALERYVDRVKVAGSLSRCNGFFLFSLFFPRLPDSETWGGVRVGRVVCKGITLTARLSSVAFPVGCWTGSVVAAAL